MTIVQNMPNCAMKNDHFGKGSTRSFPSGVTSIRVKKGFSGTLAGNTPNAILKAVKLPFIPFDLINMEVKYHPPRPGPGTKLIFIPGDISASWAKIERGSRKQMLFVSWMDVFDGSKKGESTNQSAADTSFQPEAPWKDKPASCGIVTINSTESASTKESFCKQWRHERYTSAGQWWRSRSCRFHRRGIRA